MHQAVFYFFDLTKKSLIEVWRLNIELPHALKLTLKIVEKSIESALGRDSNRFYNTKLKGCKERGTFLINVSGHFK